MLKYIVAREVPLHFFLISVIVEGNLHKNIMYLASVWY